MSGRTDAGLPDATISGDIVELIDGGKPKGGSERKVGTFQAVLQRSLAASEDSAPTGANGALQVVCVASTDVRCR